MLVIEVKEREPLVVTVNMLKEQLEQLILDLKREERALQDRLALIQGEIAAAEAWQSAQVQNPVSDKPTPKTKRSVSPRRTAAQLEADRDRVVGLVDGRRSASNIATQLGLTRNIVLNILKTQTEAGVLETIGSGIKRRWRVKEPRPHLSAVN